MMLPVAVGGEYIHIYIYIYIYIFIYLFIYSAQLTEVNDWN